jgi:hypothetical protein
VSDDHGGTLRRSISRLYGDSDLGAGPFRVRRCCNHRKFGQLRGRYRIKPKFAEESLSETASIEVHNNVLSVEFKGIPNESVIGKIAMNEVFPSSGEGHYEHIKDGRPLWGFWKLQVGNSNTLLVHHMYADHNTLVTQGFIWDRI